jgi:hypothetical protein
MNDETPEEQIESGLYGLVEGQKPAKRYDPELFISHNTKTIESERNVVRRINKLLLKPHELSTFFDESDMRNDPVGDMNQALNNARMILPICTPKYINAFNNVRNSWPYEELGIFIQWQNSHNRHLIIPVLLGITRREFAKQGQGIPALVIKQSVEIPPEYKTDRKIISLKVKEIVEIYNEYLKQW